MKKVILALIVSLVAVHSAFADDCGKALTGTFTAAQATILCKNWQFGNPDGSLIGVGAGSAGWQYVTGANTACTTTCGAFKALFGVNLAGGATAPVIVEADDATADACVCAGA